MIILMASCEQKRKTAAVVNSNQSTPEAQILINNHGDAISAGSIVQANGKWIDPNSVPRPIIGQIFREVEATPLRSDVEPFVESNSIIVPKEPVIITTGENGVPAPRTEFVPPEIVPAIHPPPTPVLPPEVAQEAVEDIRRLGVKQGLNANTVLSIMEDSRGFLWFTTEGQGVNRYDGFSAINFTTKEGLVHDRVHCILEDKRGHFWFGTEDGVSRYDGRRFFNYPDLGGFNDNNVFSIMEDSREYLWFGTDHGVFRFEPIYDGTGKGYFTHYTTAEGLSSNAIRGMIEDDRGRLWFGTLGGGVIRFEPANDGIGGGRFFHYTISGDLNNNVISLKRKNKQENLWIGTHEGGVYRYDPADGGTFIQYRLGNRTPHVGSVIEDTRKNLWIGTWDGLFRFDGVGLTEFKKPELSRSFITNLSLQEDSWGNIWIGTLQGGANRFNDSGFSYYTNNGLDNPTRATLADRRGNLWISKLGAGGLLRYDPADDRLIRCPWAVGLGTVRSILEDSRGDIWFGTQVGVIRYNPAKGGLDGSNLIRYTVEQGLSGNDSTYISPVTLSGDHVSGIFEDSQRRIWFRTRGNTGVSRFDPQDGSFTQYSAREGLIHDNIAFIMEDSRNHIWFGTKDCGISRFDPVENNFIHLSTKEGLGSNVVNIMTEDDLGNLWFGTSNGPTRYSPGPNGSLGSFSNYTIGEGLNTHEVYSMMKDNQGNLWFGTDNAVSLYTPGEHGKDSVRFTTFIISEGLSHNKVNFILEDKYKNIWITADDGITLLAPRATPPAKKVSNTDDYKRFTFNKSTGLKLKPSRPVYLERHDLMCWLSDEGLITLDLKRFTPFAAPPKIKLNTIEIAQTYVDYQRLADTAYRQKLDFGDELLGSFDSVPVYRNYPVNLSLPHHLNHLTFRFSAIDWSSPGEQQYRFMLEGLEKKWSLLTSETKAAYPGLRPGRYTFKVQALGATSIWSGVYEYKFRILPPWWLAWQAYLSYGLILAFFLYQIYSYLLARQLASAEAKRLKELDAFKVRLFTNITHEFRTPLTIILGMVRQIRDNPKKWYNEGLDMISRNGRQLLGLVNQMLDLSKLDKGKLKLQMQRGEIVKFLHYLVQSFESFAAGKNIQLHFLKEIDQLEMDFDPAQLTKVASNLLSNAVKYTPEGGQVYVLVERRESEVKSQEPGIDASQWVSKKIVGELRPENGYLRIKIKDTGVGVAPEELPHIFDRFYQADSSDTRKSEGTGVGLALTKELIHLMGGAIQVQSKLGEGSNFSVLLPISRSAPKAEPVLTPIDIPRLDTIVPAGLVDVSAGQDVPENWRQTPKAPPGKDLPLALLIEDNRDVLTYLASCLEANYQLEFAMNGQEGVAAALEIVPDIIISDVMMPELDGYEVCKVLKEDVRTSHIPIILLTAKADQDSRIAGLKSGADAYLAKPFHKEELKVRLEQLLELRRRLQVRYGNPDAVAEMEEASMSKEDLFLRDLRKIIEENLSEENFGVVQLCRKVGMSRSQLHNKLKALTGQSASLYIRGVRLEKAKVLLRTTDMNISEVAYEVGFRTPVYFTQVFTAAVGAPPSQFKNMDGAKA